MQYFNEFSHSKSIPNVCREDFSWLGNAKVMMPCKRKLNYGVRIWVVDLSTCQHRDQSSGSTQMEIKYAASKSTT